MPGAFANIAPVCAAFAFPGFKTPLDFGKNWRGKPILGPHKTWRGLTAAVIFSLIVVFLQKYLYNEFSWVRTISLIPYNEINIWLIGLLIGLGVMVGDAAESFIKRRMKVAPGSKFFPWDQIDALIGGLVFLAIVYVPPGSVIIFLLFFAPILHIAVKQFGYLIKVNKTRW